MSVVEITLSKQVKKEITFLRNERSRDHIFKTYNRNGDHT